MKTRTLLVAAVMFLSLSAASFAQMIGTFEAGSVPKSAVIQTGYTELAGDVTFTLISGTSQLGTITLSYGGLAITTSGGTTGIIVTNGGDFAATPAAINAGLSNLPAGILVLNIPAGVNPSLTTIPNFIRIGGVRLSAVSQGSGSVNVFLTAINNAIVAGQQNLQVINAMQKGIDATGGSGVTMHSGLGIPLSGTAYVTVAEHFAAAYDGGSTGEPGANKSTVIKMTLDKLPPPGMWFEFPGSVTDTGAGTVWQTTDELATRGVVGTTVIKNSSSTSLNVFYRNTGGDADDTVIESFTVNIDVDVTPGTQFLAAEPVNIHVTLDNPSSTFVPRYAVAWEPWIPVVMFTQPRTSLLIPFGQTMDIIGYNTGIAVANTTTDPGAGVMGIWINTATPQAGKITFYGYGRDATTDNVSNWVFDTSAAGRPGQGLDAGGKLASGQTYTVMLSEILNYIGATGSGNWRGYIIVVADFTNGHGLYTISNFSSYSQGQAMNVFQWPRWGALAEGLLQ